MQFKTTLILPAQPACKREPLSTRLVIRLLARRPIHRRINACIFRTISESAFMGRGYDDMEAVYSARNQQVEFRRNFRGFPNGQ